MSNRIKVQKISNAISRFEKSVEYINRKIDERSQNGRTNEDDYKVSNHFSGTDDNGNRCWTF